ncbi:MAG: tape measure protein [Anaerococcus sp.]|nr:tape measure protein [Anaerococcus sp.]
MAIKERVVLVDEYSSKAKKIEASTSAMGEAMDKIRGTASSMGSALKSAFNRTYKVDIKDTGSKYLENRVNNLQKSLNGISKGNYKIDITAKTGRLDKLKTGISEIKSQVSGLSGKVVRFKTDLSALRNARKEAKSLQRELKSFTGKRHTIKIDLEKSSGLAKFMGGGFKDKLSAIGGGIKSGFSGAFNVMKGGMKLMGKLSPLGMMASGVKYIGSKFGIGGGSPASGGSGESPNIMKSIIGGNLITGAITKGVGAISNIASSTIGAGFNRLTSIESAQARLRGFGYNQKQVGNVTKSATEAVTGTQYSLGDAMTASASAITAGIKETELTDYLKEVGNAAAATGSDFNDIASIMNKVKTTGHLQADEMMQLSDRGLPVLAKLAEQAGVSADEMQERISDGLVGFDEFRNAVKLASGNAAEEVAKTWGGAKDNFKSAIGKLGAGLLGGKQGKDGEQGGVFGLMTPALLKVNDVLNGLVPAFQNAGDTIKDFAVNGFNKLKAGFDKVGEFMKPAIDKFKQGFENLSTKFGEIIGPLKEKFATAFEGLKEAFAPLVEAFSTLFGDSVGGQMDVFSTMLELAGQALSFLADIIISVSPVIQSIVEWISANIIPAISEIIAWVSGSLIPAISSVVTTIIGVLVPIFQALSDFIGTYIVPVLQALGDIITGVVMGAFHAIADVVEWAVDKFNDLVGAVGAAADALFELPGKIAGWVGDKVSSAVSGVKSFLGIGKNATGTEYFEGGLTGINERGSEMIQLARGSKIYPADKTNKIIKNEVKNEKNVSRSSSINAPITINVYGNNKEDEIAKAISKELNRLGVVV